MESTRRLKVAMIGSKGLPAVFGGIERHVEEIGRRLAAKGHLVTVFGRKPFSTSGEYMGMRVKVLPCIPTKNLETASNSFSATVRSLFEPFDIIHYHGIGPSIFSWIPSVLGRTTVSTIHAPDYRQRKWGKTARYLLRLGERTAVHWCTAPIAVSKLLSAELQSRYGRSVAYIPNGASLFAVPPFERASSMGLERERYILTVGRFIYERGFHTLLRAFHEVETDHRLVIVGEARFEEEYPSTLRALADERVIFAGYISGPLLNELYAHCSFYVLPSIVEGLPISLMEAMSFSRPVLISDIPENIEVAGGIAYTFRRDDAADLARGIRGMLALGSSERDSMGARARRRISERYTWDGIADEIERLYRAVVRSART